MVFGAASCAGAPPAPCACIPPETDESAASSSLEAAPRSESRIFSAVLGRAEAAPNEAALIHETRASARFDGAMFHARGRTLDGRARVYAASGGRLPASFDRRENGAMHRPSGLFCPYTIYKTDDGAPMALAGVAQFDEDGRDVGCDYSNGAAGVALYATYAPQMSLEDNGASAAAAIRQRFTVRGPLPVAFVEILGEDNAPLGDEPAIAGAFDIGEINAEPYKTAIWLGRTRGWHVKARATFAARDRQLEVATALSFALAFAAVDIHLEKSAQGAGV